jgi:hypothetical protein
VRLSHQELRALAITEADRAWALALPLDCPPYVALTDLAERRTRQSTLQQHTRVQEASVQSPLAGKKKAA